MIDKVVNWIIVDFGTPDKADLRLRNRRLKASFRRVEKKPLKLSDTLESANCLATGFRLISQSTFY